MEIYRSAASYRQSGARHALNCNLKPSTVWDKQRGFLLISEDTW